jgi:hypothetical protein
MKNYSLSLLSIYELKNNRDPSLPENLLIDLFNGIDGSGMNARRIQNHIGEGVLLSFASEDEPDFDWVEKLASDYPQLKIQLTYIHASDLDNTKEYEEDDHDHPF